MLVRCTDKSHTILVDFISLRTLLYVECFRMCVEFLKEILTSENICLGHELAVLYEDNDLIKFCKQIQENPNEVLRYLKLPTKYIATHFAIESYEM